MSVTASTGPAAQYNTVWVAFSDALDRQWQTGCLCQCLPPSILEIYIISQRRGPHSSLRSRSLWNLIFFFPLLTWYRHLRLATSCSQTCSLIRVVRMSWSPPLEPSGFRPRPITPHFLLFSSLHILPVRHPTACLTELLSGDVSFEIVLSCSHLLIRLKTTLSVTRGFSLCHRFSTACGFVMM